jgi:lysozyme
LVGQAHRPWLGAFWQPSFRLTFNLGAGRLQTSTLRRRINQTDWPGAALELRKWVHGGGRVLPGLVARRQAEIALLEQSI